MLSNTNNYIFIFIKYSPKYHTEFIYLFQMIFGLISIYYFYLFAIRLYSSKKIALIGSLIWGTYFPAISLERYLMGEPLACYFLIIGLYFFYKAFSKQKISFWIIAAIFIGFAALSRSLLIYFPFLLIPIIIYQSKKNHRLIVYYVVFIFFYILILSPWAIKNKEHFGVYKFGSTMNGYNLYRFNYFIKFDDYDKRPWQSTNEFSKELKRFLNENHSLLGDENEYEMDKNTCMKA